MFHFYTSDTHFGHVRCALEWRKFSSVEEHDETLVDNWNRVVKPGNSIAHLGDVVMGKFWESIKILERLNGQKFLVLGNHDRIATRYGHSEKEYHSKLEAYSQHFTILGYAGVTAIDGRIIELHHYPQENGKLTFCGHVHEKWKVSGKNINVGMDVWGITPVSRDTLAEFISDNGI